MDWWSRGKIRCKALTKINAEGNGLLFAVNVETEVSGLQGLRLEEHQQVSLPG